MSRPGGQCAWAVWRRASCLARLWCAALWLACAGLSPALSEQRISIDDARRLAVALAQGGQPTAAREAALALLSRDPDDVTALLVLARSGRDLGLFDEARAAALRAHRLAPKDSNDRFGASLAMAQVLASDGQRGRAQLWLRRAAAEAPTEQARAVALRDLSYVRWRKPLSVRLTFNAFPSSNVNGGPTTNTIVIGGFEFVDPTAVPLPGVGVSAGVDLSLRLFEESRDRLTFGLSADATVYDLSDRAQRLVPTARAEDYGTAQLSFSLGWDGKRDWGRFSASAGVGRDWRGGQVLADWTRLALTAQKGVGTAGVLDFSVEAVRRDRRDLALRSSSELGLGAGWTWALADGDSVRIGMDLRQVWSQSASVARSSARAEVTWRKADPVLGMSLSAFGSLEVTDYAQPLGPLGTQHDLSAELGISAVLSQMDVLGFAPEIGFVLSRTNSSIAANTTEAAEIRLGIRSIY